jgi:hypothetical protein
MVQLTPFGCTKHFITKSKFVVVNEVVTKEIIWLWCLLSNICISQHNPTMIYNDNQSAIWLMNNPKYHKRTKHIDTKYYFIHEKWKTLEVEISYVHIHNQTSNLLTKSLLNYMFQKFHSYMGMVALTLIYYMSKWKGINH